MGPRCVIEWLCRRCHKWLDLPSWGMISPDVALLSETLTYEGTAVGSWRGSPVATAVAPSPQLTALDRCDRCGAQAYVRVELTRGGELLFCAHHAREHADKLEQVAVAIQDETGRLTSTPAIAPLDER